MKKLFVKLNIVVFIVLTYSNAQGQDRIVKYVQN